MPRPPVTLIVALLALPVPGSYRASTPASSHPMGNEFIVSRSVRDELAHKPTRGADADRTVVTILFTGSRNHLITPIVVGLSRRDVEARRYDPANDPEVRFATGVVVSAARLAALLAVVDAFEAQAVRSGRLLADGDITARVYEPHSQPETLVADRDTSVRLLARLKQVGNGFPELQAALDELARALPSR